MLSRLAEILSIVGTQKLLGGPVLLRLWVRHFDKITALTTVILDEVVPSHHGYHNGIQDSTHQSRILCVRLFLL